jgi:hypothetical protein
MHLTPNGCVAIRFKMLTYSVYAPLLNRIDALPLDVSYIFEVASSLDTLLNLSLFIFELPSQHTDLSP